MDAVRAELKRRREELGLTIAEAAERADMSDQWWRVLEQGYRVVGDIHHRQGITRSRLIKMAKALHWKISDAVAMAAGEPLSPQEHERHGISEELARVADTLPIAQQQALLLLAKSMKDPATQVSGPVLIERIPDETPTEVDDHSHDGNEASH